MGVAVAASVGATQASRDGLPPLVAVEVLRVLEAEVGRDTLRRCSADACRCARPLTQQSYSGKALATKSTVVPLSVDTENASWNLLVGRGQVSVSEDPHHINTPSFCI